MKNKILLFLAFMISYSGISQTHSSAYSPKIIPPSPNAAALGKFGNVPVSYYTGVPQISVPIYTLSSRKISVPIGISYHASGIKVAEEASRVGLGWALNAGGTISRTVVGEDDFAGKYFSTTKNIPMGPTYVPKNNIQLYQSDSDSSEFINTTNQTSKFVKLETDNGSTFDYQPDLFTFNIGGLSGRFSITKDKQIVLGKHEKIKIEMKGNPNQGAPGQGIYWEVTSPDGILYRFKQVELVSSSSDGIARASSWHITEIISPDGDKIKFEYATKPNLMSLAYSSISETKSIMSLSSSSSLSCTNPTGFAPVFGPSNSYNIVYLTAIKSVNETVVFDYTSREDLSNELKLSSISIKNLAGTTLYKHKLEYSYFIGNTLASSVASLPNASDSKRLKLLSIQKCSGDDLECMPKHLFTYNEGNVYTTLPSKNSFAIDHWGYYNGKNNSSIIPDYVPYPSTDIYAYNYGVLSGNQRNTDPNYAQAFVLRKITYPTGGATKFNYEASSYDIASSIKNDMSVDGKILPVENKSIQILYGSINSNSGLKKDTINLSTLLSSKDGGGSSVTIDIFARFADMSGACNRSIPTSSGLAYVKIIDISKNQVFDQVDLFASCSGGTNGCPTRSCNASGQLQGISYTKSLTGMPGKYEVQMYAANGSTLADLQLTVRYNGFKDLENNAIDYSGNLRILSIEDSTGMNTSIRRYEYGGEQTINGKKRFVSWGKRMSTPKYSYFAQKAQSQSTTLGPAQFMCYTLYRSSNSALPLSSSASGSIVGYDKVIEYYESDKYNSTSGKTEYIFKNDSDYQYYFGYDRPPLYSSFANPENGNLLEKYDYIKVNDSYILSNYSKNEYSSTSYPNILWGAESRDVDVLVAGTIASKKWLFLFYRAMPTVYNYLKKSTIRTYDLSDLQLDNSKRDYTDNITEYFYENNNHLQLTRKEINTSSLFGDTTPQLFRTTYKYPLDLALSGNVYQQMVDNFIHTPVVREEKYLEKTSGVFTLLNKTDIQFRKWADVRNLGISPQVDTLSFKAFFAPEKVLEQQGSIGSVNTVLEFLSYDNYGNLLSYKEKNGLTNTFTYFPLGSGKAFLPQTYTNALSQTITYEYEPIIGLKSITDPNNFVTTYEYDKLGRLLRTKDQVGDINSYTYNYGSLPSTFTAIGTATGLNSTIQECKLCCTADASATSNSPIQNCSSGQIELKSGSTISGDDVSFQWKGPGGFASTLSNPKITTNLPNYTGIFTVTVTKQNSTCLATATSTVSVIVNCPCPFTIDVNSTPTTTLTCQQTIALVGNCVGCSTGDLIAGQETYVSNGKFDNGDTDFQSDVPSRFITLNAQDINGSFNNFQDHSGTGTRKMLMIGHSESTSEKVWYKTITVTPNTRYILSAWVASAYQNNQTALNWEIDGILQSTGISLAGKNGGDWQNLKNIWISGEQQTSVTIAIRKQNAFGHNWFVLDDISFTEVPPMARFEWTGPDSYLSVGKNSFVRNVGLKNSGQYQLKVTDKGCTRVATVNQNVNCTACVDPEPLELIATSNSPVSCGGTISLNASSKRGVTYTWYKINDDGSLTDFPTAEKNKATPTITAPSLNGINRYTYTVYGFKAGCTASYTVPVEVRCYPDGFIDLALNLRTEGGFNNVTAGQEFTICADVTNQDQNQYRNAASVRVKAEIPSCLQLTGSYYGFDTGNTISGHFYEDIWNGPAANEVSNISTDARRGVDVWRYWGVGIGANETRSMCFGVRALSAGPIVIKAQVVEATDPNGQYLNDSDSEPNNGYDNGEDDRSVLVLNSSAGSINTSLQIISKSYGASSSDFDVVSTGLNWTATKSDSWISLNKTSGGNGTNTVTVSVTENQSAFSRYGTITIDAGCGNIKIIKVKQAGRDDCPTVQLSSNNPFCGATLQLNANVVPAANKELVSNGTFEKGNVDFNPEYMHYYDFQGGTRSYLISANPLSDGFWFAHGECPGTNTNPQCSVVNRVRILFRGDGWYDHILGAKIQGSNNRSTWEDLYTIQSTSTTWQDFTFANTQKYMYVRFVSGSNGNGEIREIEFYNNTTKLSGQLFGSVGIQGADALANAIDGDPNTIWRSSTTSQESFIGFELTGCSLSGNLATSQSGYGKQMVVAASWVANAPFWSQTIMVDPNQDYILSVKGVQLGNYDSVPIKLQFEVNGKVTDVVANLPTNGCEWKKISGIWNSGANFGPVKITLRFTNANASDKIFAIDDISVKASTSSSVSTAPISYTWLAPNPTAQNVLQTANIPNPTITNVSATHNGIYKLTATQNNCAVTESIEVDVACSSQTCPAPNISSPNRLLCANMGQTSTLTATGCPAGSTVEWSTGQTGATITTPAITTSTEYFAQCRTACGLSNRSNKVTIFVMGISEPPVINATSTIEAMPGQSGITLTASGCSTGYIRWMNGTVGNTLQLPSLGYSVGNSLEVTAKCVNDCGESTFSNKVTITVVCNAKIPVNPNIVSSTSCEGNGLKSVTLSTSCEAGRPVWAWGSGFEENNTITKLISENTTFNVYCKVSDNCLSDVVSVYVPYEGKPSSPIISSNTPYLESNSSIVIDLGNSVTLNSKGCAEDAETRWNVVGFPAFNNLNSRQITVKPTTIGDIIITSYCKKGNCISDLSSIYKIQVKSNCNLPNTLAVNTSDTVSVNQGASLNITASGCTGGTLSWYYDGKEITNSNSGSSILNVNTNVPSGYYQYSAVCYLQSCKFQKSIYVKINTTQPCGITASVTEVSNYCGDAKLSASSNTAGASYKWYYHLTEFSNKNPLTNGTYSEYTASQDGFYTVEVSKNGCTARSTKQVILIATISTPVVTTTSYSISLGGTVTLPSLTCSANTVLQWYNNETNEKVPNTVSPSSNTGYYAQCIHSIGGCKSPISSVVNVVVNCSTPQPKVSYNTPSTKVCQGQSVTLLASECSGTVKWYIDDAGGASVSTGSSYTTNASVVWTTCTGSNSCESAKKKTEISYYQNLTISSDCDFSKLTASVTDDATGLSYEWRKNSQIIEGITSSQLSINSTGTYTVSAKKGGVPCIASSNYIVTEVNGKYPSKRPVLTASYAFTDACQTSATISIIAQPNNIYSATSTNFDISGTPAFFNSSSTNFTAQVTVGATQTKTYSVNAYSVDGACSAYVNLTIDFKPPLNRPTLKASDNCVSTINPKVLLQASNCPSGSVYEWYSSGTAITGNSTTQEVNPSAATTYKVRCKQNGCYSDYSADVVVTSCALVTDGCEAQETFSQYGTDANMTYIATLARGLLDSATVASKRISFRFESYCIPDRLEFLDQNDTVVFTVGCNGSGCSTSNGYSPCQVSGGVTTGYITAGLKVAKIRVTRSCGPSTCTESGSSWNLVIKRCPK